MLKIKLYVILSILLVFNLFEKLSCARSGGGVKTNRGRNNCKGGGGGWTPITSSIDCKYFVENKWLTYYIPSLKSPQTKSPH